MLVWAEPASTGRFGDEPRKSFEAQIEPMVRRDGNHPSIAIWGLYNEEWGLDWDVPGDPAKQDALRSAFRQIKALDPSRPAVDNSGWAHVETDLIDWHIYDEHPQGWAAKVSDLMSGRADHFPVSVAVGTVVQKHLMADGGQPPAAAPNLNSEYGGGYTSIERGWNLHWQTQELRRYDDLSGYIWTELYDIEHETAGLYTFDRAPKDLGGNPPAASNAATVLVVDAAPQAPGRDLVIGARAFEIAVRVSHHGRAPRQLQLEQAWGALLGPLDSASARQPVASVDVKPFVLTEPELVRAVLPDGVDAGRLHFIATEGDFVVAHSWVDVVLQRPAAAGEQP